LAVALLLAESCLRLCCPVTYGEPRQDFSDVPWMAALHRPSDVPGLAFEMAPHREKLHFDVTIRTNRFGMRDDEVTIAKPDSVRRIAAIGDSYIFGFGVPVDRNLPSRLEQILNEWTAKGWSFDGMKFAMRDSSKRPSMAFVTFTREVGDGGAE